MTDGEKIVALRELLEQISLDLDVELKQGGVTPTVFPEDIDALLAETR